MSNCRDTPCGYLKNNKGKKMKKLLTTLLLLYTTLFAKEAILKLDTKGHTALIRDIIVTKSGDIISASDDKTIRVWDSRSGREKRKILGQIGARKRKIEGVGETVWSIGINRDSIA